MRSTLPLLLLLACNGGVTDDTSVTDDTGVTDDTAAADTVAVTLEVRTATPVVGAEVCPVGGGDCVTTGDDGNAVLQLPPSSEVALRITAADRPTTLIPFVTGTEDETLRLNLQLNTLYDRVFEDFAEAHGFAWDTAQGTVVFNARASAEPGSGDVAGVSVAIAPDDGEGPGYADGSIDDPFDPSRTATEDVGEANFANVPAGEYTATFTHDSFTCTAILGWPADDGTLRFPVEDGVSTQATAVCE